MRNITVETDHLWHTHNNYNGRSSKQYNIDINESKKTSKQMPKRKEQHPKILPS